MSSPAPAPRRRTRALLSVAAVAVLALTACGPKDDSSDGGSPTPSPSASEAKSLPPMDMDPFTMDVPMRDLDMVPGATLRAISGKGPDYDGAWFAVPHADAWTAAMQDAVQARVDAFTRDASEQDRRLDVQPLLAVVGRDIAATRIVSTQQRKDGDLAASRVVWYDAKDRRVLGPQDLFSESGWSAVRHELAARLQEDPDVNGSRLDAAVRDPEAAENRRVWDGLVVLEDGSLLLEVDQGSLAPEKAGVLTARVDATTLGPWLSDAGRRAQDAAQHPETLELRPEQTAAPAPTRAPGSSSAPSSERGSSSSTPSSSSRPRPSSTSGSATPSQSRTPSPSRSESSTPSSSPKPSPTSTKPTPSPSKSPSPSPSPSESPSPSPSDSPSPSPSESPTPSPSPSDSPSPSPSPSDSPSPSPSDPTTSSPSPTASSAPSPTEPVPSATATAAVTSPEPTASADATPADAPAVPAPSAGADPLLG